MTNKYFRLISIGPSLSGKTYNLINVILPAIKDEYIKILITKTSTQDLYKDNIKMFDLVINNYSDELLRKLLNKAKENNYNKNILFIFDDNANDLKSFYNKKDNPIYDLILNNRHWHMSVIFLFQDITQSSTPIRKNYDIAIFFKINRNEFNKFYQDFNIDYEKKTLEKIFKYVFDKPYNYLMIRREKGGSLIFFKNQKKISFNDISY